MRLLLLSPAFLAFSATLGLAGCATVRHVESPAPDRAPDPAQVSAFPRVSNEAVRQWIEYFSVKDRDRFQRFLSRGRKYRKVVEDFLIENDLPPELKYLALIESGYQNNATSSARAAGIWQFMPATGRNYGLHVDGVVDERRDPIRATEAAAKYLRNLYNIFGSWSLAMAAYNAGEYRIIRCILKGKSRDFWTLSEIGVLPRETAAYVPKLIAAATIGESPERYGFVIDEEDDLYPELEAVEVPSPIPMRSLAQHAGLALNDLWTVNPHLQGHHATPAHAASYEMWIPARQADRVRSLRERLSALVIRGKSASRSIARSGLDETRSVHVTRRGDNLTSIARRYGTTSQYLMKVNDLRDSTIRPGMKLRVTSRSYRPQPNVKHRVRRGENLTMIARRFGVSVAHIRKANSLRGHQIYPGQVLSLNQP